MWNASSIATREGLPKLYGAHIIPYPQSLDIETQDICLLYWVLMGFDASLLFNTSVVLFRTEMFILCHSAVKVSNLPFEGHSSGIGCVSEEILNLDI